MSWQYWRSAFLQYFHDTFHDIFSDTFQDTFHDCIELRPWKPLT